MNQKFLAICLLFLMTLSSFSNEKQIILEGSFFNVIINYQNLAVNIITKDEENIQISAPSKHEVAIIEKQSIDEAVINYPELEKKITFKLDDESLKIHIESVKNDRFQWPILTKFDALTIPFQQGKYIPANDSIWINYLNGRSYSGLQDLSMQFFALNYDKHAAVFLIVDKFNNEIHFSRAKGQLIMAFEHEFPATVRKKEYSFIVKIADNSPTSIAKEYQKHILKTTGIMTLEEKASMNPNIRKLYGAAHFYIWSQEFLAIKNIKWDALIKFWVKQLTAIRNNPTKHVFELFGESRSESGLELLKQWSEIKSGKFINSYQKNLILRSLNEILSYNSFYNEPAWKDIQSNELSQLLRNDIQQLNETNLYQLNKQAFYEAFSPFVETIDHWGDGVSIDILNEMSNSGIKKGWLGLNEWKPAFINPAFVKTANKMGYLISPYDDYHCIHPAGKESWNTAAFDDSSLYESATVSQKDGKKDAAFLGIGRKLNPTLAFPLVKKRVEGILNQGIQFNSWFIDCDGTGEFLDDYTPGRMTSQEDDMNARMKRMAWISDEKKMVIGTEVGNDFCADVIVFAHGMTTPVIEWSDSDMRKNKNSEYYVGDYFAINGGIPSMFAKEVKVKPLYQYIYLDHRFNLPLFQLVYNNAVITSHHWEWGTLKIPALLKEREIQEILYNVPPLYHLDRKEWAKHKSIIINHVKEFSKLHQKAVLMEMLTFNLPADNRDIQITQFGQNNTAGLELVANFSNKPYSWKEWNIPPESILISDINTLKSYIYVP
jgi:hypothetical protein